MTPFDPNNFLESLIRFVAGTFAPALSLVPPREIWRGRAIEGAACAPLYTSVALYPGAGQRFEALPKKSIQWLTIGPEKNPDAVALRAQKIYEALLGSEGRPLQMKTINGFKTDGTADGTWQLKNVVFIQTPGALGPDEEGRPQWVFNTDIDLCKLT